MVRSARYSLRHVGLGRLSHYASSRILRHGGKRRIGLYGGSFNPVHRGHWCCAEALRKALKLHQVCWMVTPQNPLKSAQAHYIQRETQLRLFLHQHGASRRGHVVSREHLACGSIYAIDTLRHMLSQRRHRYYWLGGTDLLPQWHHWRDWPRLGRYMTLCLYNRPMAHRAALGVGRRQVARYVRGPKTHLASRELRAGK